MITIGLILYFIIGCIISGIMYGKPEEHKMEDMLLCVLFWPPIVVFYPILKFMMSDHPIVIKVRTMLLLTFKYCTIMIWGPFYGAYKLGEKINRRFK